MTLVLPLPGPANISTGPSIASTASLWAGLSTAKISMGLNNYYSIEMAERPKDKLDFGGLTQVLIRNGYVELARLCWYT
jgi:hypothetical protein